ncbi:MAG TPA: phage tail sheath C-terminal domain-containing protein [Polyangiaceae bacterium]|nr:phage tail sheath C-terminal domain-containing protein [Polyangiaceae bacterium]
MPEYLYPGVYVEEVDTGNKPIEGVSTSTVGFLGIAERGPEQPTFITSFSDFVRYYGRYLRDASGTPTAYLAYSVEGFFQNGGKRCYVSRVFASGATKGAATHNGLKVDAIGPGSWSGRLYYAIVTNPNSANLFTLQLFYYAVAPAVAPATVADINPREVQHSEVFEDLSIDPTSANFYERRVNFVSTLITVSQVSAAAPGNVALAAFPAGSDAGTPVLNDFLGQPPVAPGQNRGLLALEEVEDISLLCCPDEWFFNNNAIAVALRDQAERLRYRFAILGSPQNPGALPFNPSVQGSKYAAFYYPWLHIIDGATGKVVQVPPTGHVAGIYARTDTERGVHKAPANATVNGIDSLVANLNNQQQAALNPIGVNVIRYFRGSGNLVWGARTVSSDPDWKYVNVRRLFIFVEKSIERGTQWVVFEPNDTATWARVRRSVSDFLTRLWMDGMLQGTSKEQAFFVKCDRTTMTQADIDNGRLICLVGIAPVKPAEFVIFRIGQWTGGSEVTEQ